jgi:hypothetical protein
MKTGHELCMKEQKNIRETRENVWWKVKLRLVELLTRVSHVISRAEWVIERGVTFKFETDGTTRRIQVISSQIGMNENGYE